MAASAAVAGLMMMSKFPDEYAEIVVCNLLEGNNNRRSSSIAFAHCVVFGFNNKFQKEFPMKILVEEGFIPVFMPAKVWPFIM